MGAAVTYDVDSGVAFVTIANPPVNALTRDLRDAVMDAIDRAEEDDGVEDIVLIGAGASFPAGAELSEYQAGFAEPLPRDLCARLDFAEKPVVAALHGTVFGVGLELALAAHYRLALTGTRFGLPEIRLGLGPCAGGSQRLPRLVGARAALDMLLDGQIVLADRLPGSDLVDAVVSGDLRSKAIAFCARLREQSLGVRPTQAARRGFADPAAYQKDIAARRDSLTETELAGPRGQLLSLVEAAALLPFEAGLSMEDEVFAELRKSGRSDALVHGFVAERAARRAAEVPADTPRIDRVAVLGAGALAVQITETCLAAGLEVAWVISDEGRRREAAGLLRQRLSRAERMGRISPAARADQMDRLRLGALSEVIGQPDMMIYAAAGESEAEWTVPASVPRGFAMPGPVSGLGLRFALPVADRDLVELVIGPDCTPDAQAMGLRLAERLSKLAVVTRSSGRSVTEALAMALHRAADALVDCGADPYQIDAAVLDWGWATPPFQTRDAQGLEGFAKHPRAAAGRNWSAVMMDHGRLGRASGQGFYTWAAAQEEDPAPDRSAVLPILDGIRPAAPLPDADIMPLLLGAMANQGLRLLREGVVQRAGDIDLVSLRALDLPAERGGVMKAVSQTGLFSVQRRMERLGHGDTEFWTPEPAWRDLVKNGRDFSGL